MRFTGSKLYNSYIKKCKSNVLIIRTDVIYKCILCLLQSFLLAFFLFVLSPVGLFFCSQHPHNVPSFERIRIVSDQLVSLFGRSSCGSLAFSLSLSFFSFFLSLAVYPPVLSSLCFYIFTILSFFHVVLSLSCSFVLSALFITF